MANLEDNWSHERILLKKLVSEEGTTVSDIAREIGLSRPAVSRYLNGNYPESEEMLTAVRGYLSRIGRLGESSDNAEVVKPTTPKFKKNIKELGFIVTEDSKRVYGTCQACHRDNEFGLITGNPGTGKTFALEAYQRENFLNVVIVTCDKTSTVKSVLIDIAEALETDPKGSSSTLLRKIVKELKKHKRLIIVDEADLVTGPQVLEVIRAVYDKSKNCGIILCGNNVLEERILMYAEDRPEMARLRDRIGYYSNLSGISENEANEFLDGVNLAPEARKMLASIGRRRGIRQLVKALGRLLDVTAGEQIKPDLVQELGQIVLSFNA
ncbi:AAA family ATPase [Desulfotruncus alcoholivorax]|uniref:AAA family ATPase n=1 Tax=Desulfotruncus alcoholivorax TaxID=265477 RepID=UPI0003F6CCF1|nr:AAA family ATPase [Desulfotruncus alcoholivorax]